MRQQGVYLITGGLGRIGLDLAEHLAVTAAAKLVLVGRTSLPPRTQWDRWLHRHDAADRITRAITCIRRCEEHGAEVLALAGDVADEDRMQDILRATLVRFGVLHGVIHAAGETAGPSLAPISTLTPALCERQFQAKAAGLYVLDRVLEPLDLDFCVVMSSPFDRPGRPRHDGLRGGELFRRRLCPTAQSYAGGGLDCGRLGRLANFLRCNRAGGAGRCYRPRS